METLNYNQTQTNGDRQLKEQVTSNTTSDILAMFDPKSVDNALYQKCKVHLDEDSDYIVIVKNAECSRVCMKCMQEKGILFSNIVSVRQLLFASPQPLLSRYPVLANQEVKIDELKKAKDIRDAFQSQINEYKRCFNNLLNAVSIKKSQVNDEISEMEESYKHLMTAYENISNIKEFKRIIIKSNNSVDDDQTELKDFVNAHCEMSQENSKILDEKIAAFKNLWSDFTVDMHQEDFKSIILKINQLKFLTQSPKLQQSESPEKQTTTIEGEIRADQQCQNNDNEETQKQSQEVCTLRQQLKQLLEKQEQERQLRDEETTQLAGQVHALQEEVKRLNAQITDLQSNLIACKQQSMEEKTIISEQCDRLVNQKVKLQIEVIDLNEMRTMQGKETDMMIRQIESQEKRICQYFTRATEIKDRVSQLARIMPINNKFNIQEHYPEQLAQVNKEFQELQENVTIDQNKTKANIQFLNNQLCKLIQQSNNFDKLVITRKETSEKLFSVNNEQINILPGIQLRPSYQFKHSKDLEISQQNQPCVRIQKSLLKTHYSQCYFNNQLQQDKKYIIRVQLNGTNQVALGLIPQEEKDTISVLKFDMFYSEVNGGTCSIIVKGNKLDSSRENNHFNKGKCVEIRISLQDNIFKIGDYPGYQNVNQLKDPYAQRLKYSNYYFAIWLSSESGNNEVKVLEAYQINQFDSKM